MHVNHTPLTTTIPARNLKQYDVIVFRGFFGATPLRISSIEVRRHGALRRVWVNGIYAFWPEEGVEIDTDGNGHMSRMLADDPLMLKHAPGDDTPWFFLML
ncbi:hypothetical protein PP997_gp29 [Gordonia phage BigChungus]|uniref:Uncharacterized protein n=1 Tax=Gordonia phage BigChungus TaxID=2762389 RepID=A0A7G8LQK7_9CAUD|nr:hypothetical protein PP997_gp29 [Gordonia phage BigChungus]QNJ59389.1 hypothetical protein SEA_FEASTONYEET_29 [Gordonia phage Feastonyeet]QNJ59529.1 hypothetical protein SEA_BIGCHUNGUS_29 [Gordonia phage BigChungus]UXE03272.1 hypothetical protein SEA_SUMMITACADEMY_30 [Gordonia phage SummitAcademy]